MEEVVSVAAPAMVAGFRWAILLLGSASEKGTYMPRRPRKLHLPHIKSVRMPPAPGFLMDFKAMSIQDLLQHCRLGDEAAWEELVKRVTPLIKGVASRKVNSGFSRPALIEDLTSEVHAKLWSSLPGFQWESERKFFGWVRKITFTTVEDWRRRQKPECPLDEALNTTDGKSSSEERTMLNLLCVKIDDCLQNIGASEAEVDIFWFYYKYGYSARNISQMPEINLSENRVETVLASLIRRVRREMGGPSSHN